MVNIQSLKNLSENAKKDQFYHIAMNEATFYGKNENLKKAEEILDKMIVIAHSRGTQEEDFTDNMEYLCEVLRQTFGFYSVKINSSMIMFHPHIFADILTTSGCTYCHAALFKYARVVVGKAKTECIQIDKKHQSVKFDKKSHYGIRIFIGMELFADYGPELSMTGAEILAILLHEIGHNFYIGPVKELTWNAIGMMTSADFVSYMVWYFKAYGLVEVAFIAEEYLPDEMQTVFMRVYNSVSQILTPISSLHTLYRIVENFIKIAFMGASYIINIPVRVIKVFMNYDSEKYSDAFATSYGYGAELSSALNKMRHYKVQIVSANNKAQNVIDFVTFICRIPISIINMLLDEHPNNEARLMNDIKYMEEAGKAITNPHLKKEFEVEMKKMYALREDIKSYRGFNPVKLSSKYLSIIQDLTKISDIKEIFSSLQPKWSKYRNLDM